MSFVSHKGLFLLVMVGGLLGCTPSASDVDRLEWPEMGTVAALSFRGISTKQQGILIENVRTVYQRISGKLNAWNPESELSRLTTTNDWRAHVSSDVVPCYEAAFRLMEESRGAFNPLLAAMLREKGFTRRSALVDLGGIAKGFAVDCAYESVQGKNLGRPSVLIDLGGNLRACGGEWRVGIRNPFGSDLCARVLLRPGEALATSGTYERGGHILDGHTGKTAESGLASVTVLASTALLADGLSTTLFVLGEHVGRQFLADYYPTVGAFFVRLDGTTASVGLDDRFLNETGWTRE